MSRRCALLHASLPLLLAATGCSKVEPPQIVPRDAKVTAIGAEGVEVVVAVVATNPNRVDLSVQSVTARATLDGKWGLGTVTIARPVKLLAGAATTVDAPLKMTLNDVQSLTAVVLAQRPVPFVVDGTVKIGGEHLNVDVPFQATGTISREQLAGMAVRGLPAFPRPLP